MDRKRILICDDQDRFIEQFKQHHGDYYDIIPLRDIRQVIDKLHEMRHLPDLVLLDLYHPISEDEGFDQRQEAAEMELTRLNEQIERTKRAVDETWRPLGLDILRDIRREYNAQRLPVVIYSQRGLFLLDDEQVRSVEEHNGHWLLKNQFGPRTEKTRMDRIMNYAGQARPLLRFYRTALATTWAVLVALLAAKYVPLTAAAKVLASLGLAVIGGILTYFLTRLYETNWDNPKRR
jgi:CheY-like chemotaxis protein